MSAIALIVLNVHSFIATTIEMLSIIRARNFLCPRFGSLVLLTKLRCALGQEVQGT